LPAVSGSSASTTGKARCDEIRTQITSTLSPDPPQNPAEFCIYGGSLISRS
jgi:hypothetical protein